MSDGIRIILGLFVFGYFLIIVNLVAKKILSLKYSLLWLASCVVLALLVLFPKILLVITRILQIELPINALFLACFIVILLILLSLTVITSKQTNRIRILVQDNALMEKRIRQLEELLNEKQ